ncbi:MAG: hypothetical protein FWF69_09645 [Firmicutes bacterium]|nr:hypothetical protein [Bacillota bacterium]
MNKNEIAAMDTERGYLALSDFNLNEALSEELAGLDGGFERIKLPAGGSTTFEIPGEEPGKTEAVKEFSGVILYHHPLYAFYRDKYAGGTNPPDCGSYDGVTGQGDPGGSCAACPLNQFGSGENGAKACKNRRRIYILREGEILPLLLSLPTGSLKEFSRYVKRLLARGKKTNSVVTRFSLTKATNAGGIAYSQAQFAVERGLSSEEYALIGPLSGQIKARSRIVSYEVDNPMDAPMADPETGEIIPALN